MLPLSLSLSQPHSETVPAEVIPNRLTRWVVQVYFEQMDFDCLPLPVLKLKSLKRLKLCDCASLRSLPPEPASLKELEELSLNYCSGLERLPDLSQITALKDVPTIGASAAAQA